MEEEPIPTPLTEQEIEDFLACSKVKDYSYSLNDLLNEAGLLITNVGNEKIINQINFGNPTGQITEMILQGPRTKTPSRVLFQLQDPAEYGKLGFEKVEINVTEPNNSLITNTRNFELYCNNEGVCTCRALRGGRTRKRILLNDPRFDILKLKT